MAKKPATIFDHIAGITYRKKDWNKLTEADQKSFSPYIINRWLSMHTDLIEIIDMFQQYTIGPLSKKHVYQLYHNILPSANFRAKYIKGKKVDKYNKELITYVKNHFEISKREAEMSVDLMVRTTDGIQHLVDILKLYGKSEKEIKKLLK